MTTDEHAAPPPSDLLLSRRRFLLLVGGGTAGALLLGGCADDGGGNDPAAPGGTTLSEDVESLDPKPRPELKLPHGAFGFPSPFASNGGIGYIQMSLLYDTLLWKDGSGQLVPWLAESFDRSPDNLTYTFQLRDGVKWSDGKPLSAEDVVFTFDYYKAQESLPPPVIIQAPTGVESVRATPGNAVVITLTAPDVTFAEQVAGALPIVPRHVWSSITDPAEAQDLKILVGSGAYRLESYEGDGGPLLYTARDDYFLGAPFVRRIQFNEVGDEFAALLAGAIDAGGGSGIRSDTLAPFRRDEKFAITSEKSAISYSLYWNLSKGGPLADVRFRQACAKAINRQDLVERLAGGNGSPGNPGFLGRGNPMFAEVEQYAFDVEGAKKLLDEAGYSQVGAFRRDAEGKPLRFELLVANEETPLAELIKAALVPIGVEIAIKPVQIGPALFGAKLFGGYEMALLPYPGPSAGSVNADPDFLRRVFSSKAGGSLTSATGYANATFDDLAEKQRTTFDEGARKDLVVQMQRILATDLPVLALYYPETFMVFRKEVLDQWYFTPGGFPTLTDNKQLFITGVKEGSTIRPTT